MDFSKSFGNLSEQLGKYWVSIQYQDFVRADKRTPFSGKTATCQHAAKFNFRFPLDYNVGLTDNSSITPPPLRLPSGDAQPWGGFFMRPENGGPLSLAWQLFSLKELLHVRH